MKTTAYKAEDYKIHLWKRFLEETKYIPERLRETMGQLAGCYIKDTTFLFRVYQGFVEQERFLEDEEHEVKYERDGQDYILSYQGRECVFSKEDFHRVLASMLDLLEDTLPLGSVVALKKSAYEGVAEIEKVDEIRMVVTYRFLGSEEEEYYFPYAGVVYPTGMPGKQEVLYFTGALVEKVVQRGYGDEKEDAYVYLMKQELIIEKGKNSYGYATKEAIEKFNRRVKKKGEGNGRESIETK